MILLAVAVLIRALLYQGEGEIQTLSYWTIVGRIDQFLIGMIAYQFRSLTTGHHAFAVCGLVLFAIFYWYFDSQGGFYNQPSYPSPSPIWIFMPTIEGLAYALMIAWYDSSFVHSDGKCSRFVALIGIYSYSIYLLHFFIVFRVSRAISNNLVDLSNIYLALIVSPICFLLMIPIGYVSYKFIESPFLKLRTRYIVEE
jgi:peptidoglycan/LPS O-acetylase OafA/YrhL